MTTLSELLSALAGDLANSELGKGLGLEADRVSRMVDTVQLLRATFPHARVRVLPVAAMTPDLVVIPSLGVVLTRTAGEWRCETITFAQWVLRSQRTP